MSDPAVAPGGANGRSFHEVFGRPTKELYAICGLLLFGGVSRLDSTHILREVVQDLFREIQRHNTQQIAPDILKGPQQSCVSDGRLFEELWQGFSRDGVRSGTPRAVWDHQIDPDANPMAFVTQREVFVHQDSARVGLYKSILDAASIPNFVRNASSNNITEMPSAVLFPVLCVLDDADYERAVELLRNVHKPNPNDASDWKCAGCGEDVPGTFEHCWKCGESAPVAGDAAERAMDRRTPDSENNATGHIRKVADALRWLVVVNVPIGIAGYVATAQCEIFPPSEFAQWIGEQQHIPLRLVTIASSVFFVRPIFWGISQLLCFAICNPARLFLFMVLGCDALMIAGLPSGIFPPWVGLLYFLQQLIHGALLSLLYLSPLRDRFARQPVKA
jgi:hypothetical protein